MKANRIGKNTMSGSLTTTTKIFIYGRPCCDPTMSRGSMPTLMSIHMYVYMHTCALVYAHVCRLCACLSTCLCTHLHACLCTCLFKRLYGCLCTCLFTYLHTCPCACPYACLQLGQLTESGRRMSATMTTYVFARMFVRTSMTVIANAPV